MFSLSEALLIMLISLPFYILGKGIYWLKIKPRLNILREILMLLLYLCIIFILTMTVLPKLSIAPDNSVSILQSYSHGDRINMMPFTFINELKEYYQHGLYYSIFFNLAGNIIPFAAVSAACALLWDYFRNFWHILLWGFISTIAIELIQIPLYRGTDIDDVILNILGYILGFLIFLFIDKFIPCIANKLNNKEEKK